MYEEHSVAVVVPAYNEEGFVGEVIETMPSFVDRVYVVDDCSTDGTWAEICAHAETAAHSSREGPPTDADDSDDRGPVELDADGPVTDGGAATTVVPIRHERNRGVGGSIKTGYQRAVDDGIDVTAVMAGDGQMDPDQLHRLLEPIVSGRVDYAKGNRLSGREHMREMSTWRLFGNVTLTFLTKVASGYWGMMDPQNGYTAISRDALERVDLENLYEQYGFSNDLLVALNTRGFRIADVSMPAVYGDEQSHIEYRSFVPNLSKLLLVRFLRRLTLRYVVTDFHPLAFVYALGALGFAVTAGSLAWLVRPGAGDDAADGFATSALLALVSGLCLLLAMTFDRYENDDMVVSVR
ncbi:glycosyltransferase family 2 protein [Natronobiforma cellulositropha]|uniref:glycosyltransferase family 2 protein n=1 Tax=Natronobiforma cellulositropha TaxID=1679076 RepID=UPI0021D5D7F6|nr:glycosyltransferase family 2 protein [Natronobiforma cellulositropha]